MTTVINAPAWANTKAQLGTLAGDLQQLINVAGPLACGMAVALRAVRRAQMAEDDGEPPLLDPSERGHLIDMCAVSAQLLGDATMDACNALIASESSVCPNCDCALPKGCGGQFRDDGSACWLNVMVSEHPKAVRST